MENSWPSWSSMPAVPGKQASSIALFSSWPQSHALLWAWVCVCLINGTPSLTRQSRCSANPANSCPLALCGIETGGPFSSQQSCCVRLAQPWKQTQAVGNSGAPDGRVLQIPLIPPCGEGPSWVRPVVPIDVLLVFLSTCYLLPFLVPLLLFQKPVCLSGYGFCRSHLLILS